MSRRGKSASFHVSFYRKEEVQDGNVHINNVTEELINELICRRACLWALVIQLTVVGNEDHDLGHAGQSGPEETVELVIALYGIESQFDAEPSHTYALRCRVKKSVAYGDGVANVAHDVVDPFLGDDFLVADLVAAVLSSSLLL